MNLTNLFNLGYFKENLKKSKAIILLCIFLIPVINVIIYLMNASTSNVYMPTLYDLSLLSIIGMYIIPVILSLTLFNFVYKRKSSDFIMSLPISKKQIFVTNTILGVAALLLMNIVNLFFTLIVSLTLSNVLIECKMIFDMFLLLSLSYVFVFTSTNIAVSLSSNKITTVVVTLLILFLVPFVHTFISTGNFQGNTPIISTYCDNEECIPKKYECFDTSCEINRKKGIYEFTSYVKADDTSYTLPYALINLGIFNNSNGFKINISMLKMAFLSITYAIIGTILFIKKKFEIVETSFKSERIHLFVRSLTTVPILCIYYMIIKESNMWLSDIFTMLFLFALIITYIIIYDLLTRKKIINIFKSLACLIFVSLIVVFTGESIDHKSYTLDVNDIRSMTISNDTMINNSGTTYNKKVINYIMSIHIDNSYDSNYTSHFNIKISTKKGKYRFQIATTTEEYNYIVNALNTDKNYLKTSKKIIKDDIFALALGDNTTYISKKDKLYDKLISYYEKNNCKEKNQNSSLFTVKLYTYNNFEIDYIDFYVEDDNKLKEEILNYYNSKSKTAFEDPNVNVRAYYVGNANEEYFLLGYMNSKLDKFIIDNFSEKVDIGKDFKYIRFYIQSNSYIFVTNKVEELDNIIREIGDNDEESTY